jgi:hypothetical protein
MASIVLPVMKRRTKQAQLKKNDAIRAISMKMQNEEEIDTVKELKLAAKTHNFDWDLRHNPEEEQENVQKEEKIAEMLNDDTAETANQILYTEKIVDRIRSRVREFEETRYHYAELFSFLLVVILYFYILWAQRDPYVAWTMESNVKNMLFTADSGTLDNDGAIAATVSDKHTLETWLGKVLATNVYTNPSCGDGTCQKPEEFEGFAVGDNADGSPRLVGCPSDCGMFDDNRLTDVTIKIFGEFDSLATTAAHSWNFCHKSEPLCWYAKPQTFTNKRTNKPNSTTTIRVFDGDWFVDVYDTTGKGGTSGNVSAIYSRSVNVTDEYNTTSSTTENYLAQIAYWPRCVPGTPKASSTYDSADPVSYLFKMEVSMQTGPSGRPTDEQLYTLKAHMESFYNVRSDMLFLEYDTSNRRGGFSHYAGGEPWVAAGPSGRYGTRRNNPPPATGCTTAITATMCMSAPTLPGGSCTMQYGQCQLTDCSIADNGQSACTQNGCSFNAANGQCSASIVCSRARNAADCASWPNCAVSGNVCVDASSIVQPTGPAKALEFQVVIMGFAANANADQNNVQNVSAYLRSGLLSTSVGKIASIGKPSKSKSPGGTPAQQNNAAAAATGTDYFFTCHQLDQDRNQCTSAEVCQWTGQVCGLTCSDITGAGTSGQDSCDMTQGCQWASESGVCAADCMSAATSKARCHRIAGCSFNDNMRYCSQDSTTGQVNAGQGGQGNTGKGGSGQTNPGQGGSGQTNSGGSTLGGRGNNAGGIGGRRTVNTDTFRRGPSRRLLSQECAQMTTIGRDACENFNGGGVCEFKGNLCKPKQQTATIGQVAAAPPCFAGCSASKLGNGRCEAPCNNYLCDYDGGDCKLGGTGDLWSGITAPLRKSLCSPKCYSVLRNNNQCDSACNTAACDWDDSDCCAKEYTTRLLNGGRRRSPGVANLGSFQVNHFHKDTKTPFPKLYPDLKEITRTRLVGEKNRLIAGTLIRQVRQSSSAECLTGDLYGSTMGKLFQDKWRHSRLKAPCLDKDTTLKAYYGVDPVFVVSSSMFNKQLYADRENCCNYNFDPNHTPAEIFVRSSFAQQIPYGFRYRELGTSANLKDRGNGFFAFLDINFDNERIKAYIEYLTKGHFIDAHTSYLEVDMLLYNEQWGESYFTVVEISFQNNDGGAIELNVKAKNFDASPYETYADAGRFILELIFIALIVFQAGYEARQMILDYRSGNLYGYFADPSNIMNWGGIILSAASFWIWFVEYVPLVQDFQPELRYNVYYDYYNEGNMVNNVNVAEYNKVVDLYADAHAIIDKQEIYMELQGMSLLFVLLRFLGMMHFQPRLGLITKTLYNAAQDLFHFVILFMVVFIGFNYLSWWIYGSELDMFSTFNLAFNTNYKMMLGDTDAFAVMDLSGKNFIGVIYIYMFNVVVTLVLLNILLAILVEAYMKVAEEAEKKDTPHILKEFAQLVSVQLAGLVSCSDESDWLAQNKASTREILQAVGPDAEEEETEPARVLKVPLAIGDNGEEWIDAGVGAIMKALSTHPDTKNLDAELMARIACTMIHRFGGAEEESKEGLIKLEFTPDEVVAMAHALKTDSIIGEAEAKLDLENAVIGLPVDSSDIPADSLAEPHNPDEMWRGCCASPAQGQQ